MDYFSTNKLIEPSKGDLLISEPYLPDPNFERTVIFLCEHDENGTFGFVLNKKAQVKLPDIIDDAGDFKADVLIGGPVQQDTLHFIHRSNDLKSEANEVLSNTYWGGNYKKLLELMNVKAIDPIDIRFFFRLFWVGTRSIDERTKS